MTTLTPYPLRLPRSIKAAAEKLSKADGTSLNQFVATAVAEKIAVMQTAAFFEERASRVRSREARGEPNALDALLSRRGGVPPREGDVLPEGHEPTVLRALPARKEKATKPASAKRRVAKTKP